MRYVLTVIGAGIGIFLGYLGSFFFFEPVALLSLDAAWGMILLAAIMGGFVLLGAVVGGFLGFRVGRTLDVNSGDLK